MKVAITTPTGNIGRKLVGILQDRGRDKLILLARDASKLAEEQSRGAEVREGDLEDPEYLKRATKDVDALFFAIPPKVTSEDYPAYCDNVASHAVAAIEANKIPHVVFISSVGAHLGKGVGLVSPFKAVEQKLSDASDSLTVLRPSFFMENMLTTLEGVKSAHSVFLPIEGETEIPMIATADIAAAAADILTKPPVSGTAIESLHGPRDYSFVDVTEAIGSAIGEDLSFVKVTPEQTREALVGKGVNKHIAELYLEMFDALQSGYMRDNTPPSEQTTTPTTFEQFARTTIAPAVKND